MLIFPVKVAVKLNFLICFCWFQTSEALRAALVNFVWNFLIFVNNWDFLSLYWFVWKKPFLDILLTNWISDIQCLFVFRTDLSLLLHRRTCFRVVWYIQSSDWSRGSPFLYAWLLQHMLKDLFLGVSSSRMLLSAARHEFIFFWYGNIFVVIVDYWKYVTINNKVCGLAY